MPRRSKRKPFVYDGSDLLNKQTLKRSPFKYTSSAAKRSQFKYNPPPPPLIKGHWLSQHSPIYLDKLEPPF